MSARLTHELTVRLDYGVFVLQGDTEVDVDAHVRLTDEATSGPGIASDERSVVVLSPHQNNFAMSLRVEVWQTAAPDDLSEWEEAFEASLTINSDGKLLYVSPTTSPHTCQVPAGRYAVRVVGSGFVSRGWPGSTRPGDHWRVQLWPSVDRVEPRRLKAWAEPLG
ncbi:hypothetical protein [Micromonospora sp. NPDC003776]